MDSNTPKYISEIKKHLEISLNSIKKETSPLLEHRQAHTDVILKVYRKAFDSLILKVVNCRDILKNIKDAYEDAINIRDDRISMFITQDRVFGITIAKEERDKKMLNLMESNNDLKEKYNSVLLQLSKTQRELEELHVERLSGRLALEEERGARYTLYFENVALHARLRELGGGCGGGEADRTYGDPVVLKISLEKCREQLSITQRELATMSEEYSDTVPRHNYDTLENNYVDLNKSMEKLELEHRALLEKHRRVLEENASVKEEVLELKDRCSELERAGTPRPQWEACGDFIGGGGARWRQLRHGLSSRDTLRVILKELGPSANTEHLEYFDGLGLDPVIPPYLQYEGKIRNLRLSRRELSVIINDIWLDKIQNGRDRSMEEHVTKYFENRYQQASVRAEWAYNLCCGSEQMLDDPQIKLFWGVLHGHLSEDIYTAHRREWCAFRDHLLKQCHEDEIISVEKFEKVAKTTFPLKSEVEINNLLDVARKQLKIKSSGNDIDVGKLFQENEEGFDRIELAKELYRQRQAAQDKYIREIVAELGGKHAPDKMITVEHFKRALALTDPAIDHIRMEKNIRWAFSVKQSDPSMVYPLPLKALAAKLAAGNIERAGARDKGRRVRKIAYKH